MTKKRMIISLIIMCSLILGLIAGFFGYLQLSLFDVEPIEKNAVSSFIQKEGFAMLYPSSKGDYEGLIPISTINDEVTYRFIQQEESNNRKIVGGNLNVQLGEGRVNYLLGSFYVPVNFEITSVVKGNDLEFLFEPRTYGKQKLNLPGFLDRLLFKEIFGSNKTIQLSVSDYNATSILEVKDSLLSKSGLTIHFDIQLPNIDELIKQLKAELNEDYRTLYGQGTDEQKASLAWIQDYDKDAEAIKKEMVEDFTRGGQVILESLTLAKPANLLNIYKQYPELESVIKKETVLNNRAKLIGDTVVGYGNILLEVLKGMSVEKKLIVSQGYPFDLESMKTVTVDYLNEKFELRIQEDILKNMDISYVDDIVYILYASEEGLYIAINLVGYEAITEEEYTNTFLLPIPQEGELTKDTDIYEDLYYAMFSYYNEDVFIRYLKNDDKEAYGIISLESNYQDFIIVALRKDEEGFKVIGDKYGSFIGLNKAFPDFNMNLATRMTEGAQLLKLDTKTKNNLTARLEEYDYIEAGEEIIYCSYDGVRYIFIALNSGEEYIQTIYRGAFLADIYPVDEALEKFNDINPLILLQFNPNKNQLNE